MKRMKQEDGTEKKRSKYGAMGNKPYKSKIEEIEEDVFEVGAALEYLKI